MSTEAKAQPSREDILPPLSSLTCTLCQAYFVNPVTLPCLHSFCQECLSSACAPPPPDHDDIGAPPVKPILRCPTCVADRSEYESKAAESSTPILAIPDSRLTRILKLVTESNVVCANCTDAPSEVHCSKCDEPLCQACFDSTHSARVFASHEALPLSHPAMNALPMCGAHPGSEVEFWCTVDSVGVCQVCLLKGDHKGHDYRMIQEVRAEKQAALRASLQQGNSTKSRLAQARRAVTTSADQLGTSLEESRSHVRATFGAIRDAVAAREAELLLQLDTMHQAKANALAGQATALHAAIDKIGGACEGAQRVIRHSNDLELVEQTALVYARLRSVAAVASTNPSSATCSRCAADATAAAAAEGEDPATAAASAPVCQHPCTSNTVSCAMNQTVLNLIRAYGSVGETRESAASAESAALREIMRPTVAATGAGAGTDGVRGVPVSGSGAGAAAAAAASSPSAALHGTHASMRAAARAVGTAAVAQQAVRAAEAEAPNPDEGGCAIQ